LRVALRSRVLGTACMRFGGVVCAAVLLLTGVQSCSEKTLEERMAVRVNGVGIPERRVNMIFDAYMAQLPGSFLFQRIPEEAQAELRRQITEELIDQELLYQEAQRRGIAIPDSLVAANMRRTESFYRLERQFEDRLDELGVTRKNVEEDHRKALVVETYLDEQIGDVPVSERDIQAYYEGNQAQFICRDAIHTRHMLFRVPSGASLEDRIEAFEQAKEVLAGLRAGEDFAGIAKAVSQDEQSAARGGDLGFVEEGSLAPEYEKAANRLQTGEISEVVKTSFGYHIIQLLGRRKGGDLKTLDEVRDTVRILVERKRRQQQEDKIVKELRRRSTLRYENA